MSLKNRNRLLYWLEQNQDLTEWSLLYIKNNFLYKRLPRWATNIDGLEGYEREKEIKIALSTVYNLIDSKEARSLLMNLMTRAGVQHRYKLKAKLESKKNLNIIISEKYKKLFEEIKEKENLTSEKTLYRIIDFYLNNTIIFDIKD